MKIINHFIVAHRDDALLTFGGRLIEKSVDCENHIYVIYGIDGSLREDFLCRLRSRDINILEYLKHLGELTNNISTYDLIKDKLSTLSDLELGILVRKLEEAAVALNLNATLYEYAYPCGYPLRGYKKFNSSTSSIFKDDISLQLSFLFGEGGESKIQELSNLKLRHIDNLSISYPPVLHDLKLNIFREAKSQHNIYFLSGIGGHPDHIIIAQAALKFSMQKSENVSIWAGQDLPYSTVNEWFKFSPLKLEQYPKYYLNITRTLSNKLELLSSYYKSQLSQDDIDVINNYHITQFQLLHKGYNALEIKNIRKNNLNENAAVEIYYKLS